MNLLLSLTLIWMISSTAGALQCQYQSGRHTTIQTCATTKKESCAAAAAEGSAFPHPAIYRMCVPSSLCGFGTQTFSYSFGNYYHRAGLRCCKTNNCNTQNPTIPAPNVQVKDKLQCYSCIGPACKLVLCVGVEDRCFSGTAVIGTTPTKVFGCASANVCDAASRLNASQFVSSYKFLSGPTCCKTSSCNVPQTVKGVKALSCLQKQGSQTELRHCASIQHLCATADIRANPSGGPQIIRSCVLSSLCTMGTHMFSYNFGGASSGGALYCCATDGCNSRTPTFPVVQAENGLKCFTCADPLSTVCNDTLHCVGAQNRCIRGNVMDGTTIKRVFGCASSNVCKAAPEWSLLGLVRFSGGIKCCGTSFCNSAWTVHLSVVPLLLSLFAFII
ncbi:uncharacterized protein [Trachinotus anak]|uniref:uncharacterized protein n=1 Tax=Trachinotus anak TaxID=443729 RepID=UPI0039F224CD